MKNFADRIRNFRGQSTVELALILPTLCFLLFLIIYAFRANHTLSEQSITSYANRLQAFNHGNGLAFDPVKGQDVPAGQFSEHIPPGGAINLGDIAKSAAGLAAQLGLGELFSRTKIFGDTYAGGFAKGFSYSLVNSATQNFIQGGSWNDLNAKDLEHATWAGAAESLSTSEARHDFQGENDKASNAQEFFGSGAQAGLIGFARSEGDWKAGVASAASGMANSDTSKAWMKEGNDFTEIVKGAGMGAVDSSISGALNGKLEIKNVLYSAATGAVSTEAFAKTLPFTGSDAKNSAMYGAFNGAFSSVLSGGNLKTTLIAVGAGALGSKQTAQALGGYKSVGYRASTIGYQAGSGLASGQSAQAVGIGAVSGLISSGQGWAGNQVSNVVTQQLDKAQTPDEAIVMIDNPDLEKDIVADQSFDDGMDAIYEATNTGMLNAQSTNSILSLPPGGDRI